METFPFDKIVDAGASVLLAFAMFYFYRLDRKASEDTIKGLAGDFKAALETLVESVDRLAEVRSRKGDHA